MKNIVIHVQPLINYFWRYFVKNNVILNFDKSISEKIVDECMGLNYGARPLKRKAEKLLNDVIAEKILKNEINDGKERTVIVVDGNIEILTPNTVEV